MNSKIATLLSENIKNKQIIAEMIMYICNRDYAVEDHLIDLCLDTNKEFVNKYTVLKHIDKIKSILIKNESNIESVSNIKIVYVNNITRKATIEFTAKITAWFKDQESANKGNYWDSNDTEDDEHKIKCSYNSDIMRRYLPFKDIDID